MATKEATGLLQGERDSCRCLGSFGCKWNFLGIICGPGESHIERNCRVQREDCCSSTPSLQCMMNCCSYHNIIIIQLIFYLIQSHGRPRLRSNLQSTPKSNAQLSRRGGFIPRFSGPVPLEIEQSGLHLHLFIKQE